jgi:hypothetical protein
VSFFRIIGNFFKKSNPVQQDVEFFQRVKNLPPAPLDPDAPNPQEFDDFLDQQEKKDGQI